MSFRSGMGSLSCLHCGVWLPFFQGPSHVLHLNHTVPSAYSKSVQTEAVSERDKARYSVRFHKGRPRGSGELRSTQVLSRLAYSPHRKGVFVKALWYGHISRERDESFTFEKVFIEKTNGKYKCHLGQVMWMRPRNDSFSLHTFTEMTEPGKSGITRPLCLNRGLFTRRDPNATRLNPSAAGCKWPRDRLGFSRHSLCLVKAHSLSNERPSY